MDSVRLGKKGQNGAAEQVAKRTQPPEGNQNQGKRVAGTGRASARGVRVLLLAILLQATFPGMSAASSSADQFPFEHRDGLLWVRVNVAEAAKPLDFLLDSGAGVSAIDLRTVRRLGLKLGQRVSVRGVGSSATGFWPQYLGASAGGVELPREYLAVDLTELSRAAGRGVDGLIGADFFRDRVVQVDFKGEKVRLLPAGAGTAGASVVNLKESRGALLAALRVNESDPQWLRVDTGCASALHWVAGKAERPDAKATVSIGLTAVRIPTGRTRVRLGTVTFDSVPTGFHGRPIFSGEAGLLGNELLSRFERVTFDARAGRLLLEGRHPSFQ